MRKLLVLALSAALLAAVGCHITNYPVIYDDRGDYSGVIRTGHRAYIIPTSQVGTLWADGSDELVNIVYQSQFGDQKLYTKNNFDPTASVIFVDNTYCDWRYDTCVIAESWNPATGPDQTFDFDGFPDCLGYRSLSLLLSQGSRIGECGDLYFQDRQALMGTFADLTTTSFRGETAYVVPMNAGNTSVVIGGVEMPMYGQHTAFITERLQTLFVATPNVRHQLNWLLNFTAENGATQTAEVNYGDLSAEVEIGIVAGGLSYNIGRF